jgi:hypothetical protein
MTDTEITTGELARLLDTSPKTMTDPKTGFYAVYDKPTDEPGIKLRGRAETKDHALLAPPGQCQRQGARAGVEYAMTEQSENVGVSAIRERP